MDKLVLWQRVEGAAIFVAAVTLFVRGGHGWPWWIAVLVFFAPDVSFAGYLFGPKVGAFGYNLLHVYAFGVLLLAAGAALASPLLGALGALWLAHAGADRMLGYGLKSPEGFTVTHLGRIGKASHP